MSDYRTPASAKQVRTGVAVLVAASVVYALLAQTVFPFGADEALYIGAAKSMASGGGYRAAGRALTLYPPGWPLLLTPVEWLTNGDYGWFARYTAALIPLLLYASWRLYASRREPRAWWLIAALMASVSVFDIGTREVRSEIAFTAFTIGFLAWAERALVRSSGRAMPLRILGGTLLLLGGLTTRTIGLALLGAIVMTGVHLLVTQRALLAIYARQMVVPLVAGVVYQLNWGRWARSQVVAAYRGEPTAYDRWFWMRDAHNPAAGEATVLEVLGRIPGNIRIQASEAAALLTNIGWITPSWTSPIVALLAVVLLAGLIEEWRRPLPLLCWYVIGYVGVLSVWTFDEGTRYIMPLLPLLLVLILSGWRGLSRTFARWPRQSLRIAMALAVVELIGLVLRVTDPSVRYGKQTEVAFVFWGVALALGVVADYRRQSAAGGLRRPIRYVAAACVSGYFLLGLVGIVGLARFNVSGRIQLPGQAVRRVSDWIATNAPDSSVIMARQFGSLNLATHRKTVPFPLTSSVEVMRSAVAAQRPTLLVVIDSTSYDYYLPSEPARLALIERALNTTLERKARVDGASIYEFPPSVAVPPAR